MNQKTPKPNVRATHPPILVFRNRAYDMDRTTLTRMRKRLVIFSGALGVLIAAAFFFYFETDPNPQSNRAEWVGVSALFLCPASLLFVTAIDIEAGTPGFFVLWAIVTLINAVLYGGVGGILSLFMWRDDQS